MNDMAALGRSSRIKARARADVRNALRGGTITLDQILANPPDAIRDMTVFDVLRMLRANRNANMWEHLLGMHMIRDRVNLHVRVGGASERTRAWAVEHGQWHAMTNPACRARGTESGERAA